MIAGYFPRMRMLGLTAGTLICASVLSACGDDGDIQEGSILTTAGSSAAGSGTTGTTAGSIAAGSGASGSTGAAGRAPGAAGSTGTAGSTSSGAAGSTGTAGSSSAAGSGGGTAGSGTAGSGAAGSAAAGSGAGAAGTGAGGSSSGAAGAGAGGSGGGAAAGSGGTGGGAPTTSGATFTEVYGIIMASCGCHGNGNGSGGLSTGSKMAAFMNLVGADSGSCSGEKRVVAGDPDNSVLMHAIDQTMLGSCRVPSMPVGSSKLPQADLDKVRSWIAAGAKDD